MMPSWPAKHSLREPFNDPPLRIKGKRVGMQGKE
jgi:hypothetical protein